MRVNGTLIFGIIACIIANTVLNYSLNCTTTLMAYIRDDFQIDSNMAIWASNVQFIGTLGFVGVAKLLMNRMNKKRTLLIGVCGVTLTSVGIMFVNDAMLFVALRFISGVAIAFIYVSSTALLTDLSSIDNRDFVMSLNTASSCLGSMLGALSKLFVDIGLDWKVAFIPIAVMSVISIILLYRIEDDHPTSSVEIDYLAQGLFILGISLFLNGAMTLENEYGLYLLLIGMALLIVGSIHGRIRGTNVLDLGLLVRNRTFALTITLTFIFFFIQMAIICSCSYYLQVSTLSDALMFAMYVNLIYTSVQMVLSPVFGRLSCRIDKRILPIGSMLLMVLVSALCIIRMDENNARILTTVVSVLVGVASAAFMGPNTSRVMSCVDVEDRPSASALLTFVKQISKIVGSMIFVEIAIALHRTTELEAYTQTVEVLGVICVVLAAIGTYLSFKGPKEYKT